MSFSREAKDFLSSYMSNSSLVNRNKQMDLEERKVKSLEDLNSAHGNYFDALAGAGGSRSAGAQSGLAVGKAFNDGFSDSNLGSSDDSLMQTFGHAIRSALHGDSSDIVSPSQKMMQPALQRAAIPVDGFDNTQPDTQADAQTDDDSDDQQSFAKGGMVQAYAEGGDVEDDGGQDDYEPPSMSADEGSEDYDPSDYAAEQGQAIPSEAPAAPGVTPVGNRPNAPQTAAAPPKGYPDNLLGAALHSGIMFLQDVFGMKQAQAQEPAQDPTQNPNAQAPKPTAIQPGQAPKDQLGTRLFMQGVGATSSEDYDSLMKVIDPHGQLDENIRTMAGIKGVWDYYMKHGDSDHAAKAAASLIQYARSTSSIYAGRAHEALQQGKIPEALQYMVKAYDQIPDGQTASVKATPDGRQGVVTFKDQQGNVVGSHAFDPPKLIGAVVGLQNGSMFWSVLTDAAHKNLGGDGQPSQAYQDFIDSEYNLSQSTGADGGASAGASAPTEKPSAIPTGNPGPASGPGNSPTPATTGAPAGTPPAEDAGSGTDEVPGETSTAGAGSGAVDSGGEPEGLTKPTPPAAPVLKNLPKNITQMSKGEQAAVKARLINDNRQIQANYNSQLKEYNNDLKDYNAAVKAKGKGPNPAQRQTVEKDIDAALTSYKTSLGGDDPQKAKSIFIPGEEDAVREAAINLYGTNGISARRAIQMAGALTDVDPANPTAVQFKIQQTKDGATIQLTKGPRFNVPAETLKELMMIRGQKIQAAQKSAADASKPNMLEKGASTGYNWAKKSSEGAAISPELAATEQGKEEDAVNQSTKAVGRMFTPPQKVKDVLSRAYDFDKKNMGRDAVTRAGNAVGGAAMRAVTPPSGLRDEMSSAASQAPGVIKDGVKGITDTIEPLITSDRDKYKSPPSTKAERRAKQTETRHSQGKAVSDALTPDQDTVDAWDALRRSFSSAGAAVPGVLSDAGKGLAEGAKFFVQSDRKPSPSSNLSKPARRAAQIERRRGIGAIPAQ